MKKVLLGFALLLVLLLVAAGIFLWQFDIDSYRHELETAIYEQTGLVTEIDGGLHLILSPDLKITAKDAKFYFKLPAPIAIQMPDKQPGKRELARLSELLVTAEWKPLLDQELRVKEIALNAANFSLLQNKGGELVLPEPPENRGEEPGPSGTPALPLSRIVIEKITINGLDLTVEQLGEQLREVTRVEQLDFNLSNLVIADNSELIISRWPEYLSLVPLASKLEIDSVGYQGHRFSNIGLKARNKEQIVTATLQADAYSGKTDARLDLDWQSDLMAVTGQLSGTGFELADLLSSLELKQQGQGKFNLEVNATSQSDNQNQWMEKLVADASLDGKALTVEGFDLDQLISKLAESQKLNLKDVGGFALAGPLGLMLTKGSSYGGIVQGALGGNTKITELYGNWHIADQQIQFNDVAAATENNRVAVTGHFEIEEQRFGPLNLYLLDQKGCQQFHQKLEGSLDSPEVGAVSFAVGSILNPMLSLAKESTAALAECEPVYSGRVAHPVETLTPTLEMP